MTNSTPKSNKIERQGSPNGKKWSPQQRKTVTFFASSQVTTSKEVTATLTLPVAQQQPPTSPTSKKQSPSASASRQICSPTNKGIQPMPRFSPVRHDSPRVSPTNNNFYAGAKFSEPPSPATLPKPPSHWTGLIQPTTCGQSAQMMMQCNISQHINSMINIQA